MISRQPIATEPTVTAAPRQGVTLVYVRKCGVRAVVGMWMLCLALAGTVPLQGEDSSPASPTTKITDQYWAYRPVVRPAVPKMAGDSSAVSPIDALLQARLSERGLTFSPPADRVELLRRAKFDLLGLPPTPEEIDQFLVDTSEDAYDRLLDRLLASPQYGERWGRMWLDLVRFADSAGYNADPVRPLAYKYRDYVIQAFNNDTPYDRFVQEQLAGDELFPDREEAIIATGFHRLPPDESNASNVLLARQDMLNDITSVVGAVFLGQSIGCAQCHDHKFDAITQKDFYRLQAFFAGIVPIDQAPVGTDEELAQHEQQLADWLARTAEVRAELHDLERTARQVAGAVLRLKFPEVVLASVDTAREHRNALQQQLSFFAERQLGVSEAAMLKAMKPEQVERWKVLKAELERLKKDRPRPKAAVAALTVTDGPQIPPTFLLAGGSYNQPLEELQPGFLSALQSADKDPHAPAEVTPPRDGTTGRRTALAKWLTDARNPLTPRVMVNRIWQGHFGRGITGNASDFGVQSRSPSHPELLDWLAAEFVESGWSIKQLHRLIMRSAAYRQASHRDSLPDAQTSAGQEIEGLQSDDRHSRELIAVQTRGREVDPDNVLYWHYPRRRLEAESIRDTLLAVSGLLDATMYGPGVRPELPPQYSTREAWAVSATVADRHRRSVYILMKRNLPYPLLNAFDFPDMHESCGCRQVTTTAPQALMLMNSEMIVGYAQAFAGRLLQENPHAEAAPLVREAYRLAFGREPRADELQDAREFLEQQQELIEHRVVAGQSVLLPRGFPKFLSPARGAAVVDLCHALLNANELIYVE